MHSAPKQLAAEATEEVWPISPLNFGGSSFNPVILAHVFLLD